MNDLFKTLYITSGHPEDAFLRNPAHTEQEYEDALRSPEYREFLKDINDRFVAHLDTELIYNTYEAKKMLDSVYAGTTDIKYLKDISKHYLDTMRLTTPIIERIGANIRKEEDISSLQIVISNRGGEHC